MSNTELAQVREESRQLDHMNSRLSDSLFSKDLAPHYMKLAGQLASSELVPKSFRGKPQDLFICWAMGYQIGLSPEQAMQCIAVINGKPAMWGDDMLALCMAHKDFEDIMEEPVLKEDAVVGYRCIVKRKGKADKENIFTLDMAKRAGLLSKGGVWTQYPERMLKLRARGFSLRDAFPDALKGIKPREEVEDYIEAEYKISDSKRSRTQLLKEDYLIKTGKNDEIIAHDSDSPVTEKATENHEPHGMDESGNKEDQLHDEIKKLIEEKGFTEERLTKALVYYQSDSIDSLDLDSSRHFIIQLQKY